MELWIRSQDKDTLQKVDHIRLSSFGEFWALYPNDKNGNFYLGLYMTAERANEVLDEIQKLLMGDILTFKNIGTPEEVSKVLEDIKMKGFCWYTKNYPDEHSDNDKPAIEFLHRDCVVYQMPEDVKESE